MLAIGLTCLGFVSSLPVPEGATLGLPSSLHSSMCLSSPISILDHAHLDLMMFSRSSARLNLAIPALDSAHADSLLSARALSHLDLAVLTCGLACVGSSALVLSAGLLGLTLLPRSLA